MAARGPAGGPRGMNNRFAQFKLVLLGTDSALSMPLLRFLFAYPHVEDDHHANSMLFR